MAWSLHLGQRLIQTPEVDLCGLAEELQGPGYPECAVCGGVQGLGGMSLGFKWGSTRSRARPLPGSTVGPDYKMNTTVLPTPKRTCFLCPPASQLSQTRLCFFFPAPCPSSLFSTHMGTRVLTSHMLCGVGQFRVTLHLTPRKHAKKQFAYLKKTVGGIPVLEKGKQL